MSRPAIQPTAPIITRVAASRPTSIQPNGMAAGERSMGKIVPVGTPERRPQVDDHGRLEVGHGHRVQDKASGQAEGWEVEATFGHRAGGYRDGPARRRRVGVWRGRLARAPGRRLTPAWPPRRRPTTLRTSRPAQRSRRSRSRAAGPVGRTVEWLVARPWRGALAVVGLLIGQAAWTHAWLWAGDRVAVGTLDSTSLVLAIYAPAALGGLALGRPHRATGTGVVLAGDRLARYRACRLGTALHWPRRRGTNGRRSSSAALAGSSPSPRHLRRCLGPRPDG